MCLHISSVTRVNVPKIDPKKVDPSKPGTTLQDEVKNLNGTVTVRGALGYWDEQRKVVVPSPDEEAFALEILELIRVPFSSVEFRAEGPVGQNPKTSVTPHMGKVQFLGPLRFLGDLQSRLGSLLGDNFQLQITPEFVRVGFQCALPPITLGVMTLRGIQVGAHLALSFTNQPLRFGFNFASYKTSAVPLFTLRRCARIPMKPPSTRKT